MGREESSYSPALRGPPAAGVAVREPHARTLCFAPARANLRLVIAMVSRSSLIPVKTIAFDSAVNVTLACP